MTTVTELSGRQEQITVDEVQPGDLLVCPWGGGEVLEVKKSEPCAFGRDMEFEFADGNLWQIRRDNHVTIFLED